MKKLCFLFIFVLSFFQALSQNGIENVSVSDFNTSSYVGNIRTSGMWVPGVVVDNTIKGSIYLFPNYNSNYIVVLKSGKSINVVNLNFNLKSKTLESYLSKDSVFQYDLDKFDYVLKNDKRYKVFNDGDLKGLSLEICNLNSIQFFKYVHLSTTKAVINPMTNVIISDAEYTQISSYFFILNGRKVKVQLKKNAVLNALIDKSDLIKEYVKKNKLKYDDEGDICKILDYYKSIL
ncbi:hypothetical protein [Flavobacterium sp. TSSA_36]|uniref:hypothetical protein n=1 Tax=Flavobacterium sp. TSSA_36 TaxID=3447669 RepID=UPI003F32DAF0